MEFGPRALGGRSILADPRRKDMKDISTGGSTPRALPALLPLDPRRTLPAITSRPTTLSLHGHGI